MITDNSPRAFQQVARPGVVAKAGPRGHDFCILGRGQIGDCGPD